MKNIDFPNKINDNSTGPTGSWFNECKININKNSVTYWIFIIKIIVKYYYFDLFD